MKVKSESEVAQSCPTPSYPMDCSTPGSSFYGIFQARVLEWGAIALLEITWILFLFVCLHFRFASVVSQQLLAYRKFSSIIKISLWGFYLILCVFEFFALWQKFQKVLAPCELLELFDLLFFNGSFSSLEYFPCTSVQSFTAKRLRETIYWFFFLIPLLVCAFT